MVQWLMAITGMFGGINVWRIAELKVICEIRFSEWIDFGHKDTIYRLKFGLKFGKSQATRLNFPAAKHSCCVVISTYNAGTLALL